MSTSLTQLATAAAQLIGVLDSGGALSTQQYADALIIANNWLDNHSANEFDIMTAVLTSTNSANGQQSYGIGAAQAFNVQRPFKVMGASYNLSAGPGEGIEVVDGSRWESIPDRQAQSFKTRYCFYDRGNPVGNVYFSPVPRGGGTLELLVWASLTQFPDTVTGITILPAYLRYITHGIAIDLAPEYDVAPSPQMLQNYADAQADVRRLNADLFRQIPTAPSPAAPAGQ